jgi:hypothetical protein
MDREQEGKSPSLCDFHAQAELTLGRKGWATHSGGTRHAAPDAENLTPVIRDAGKDNLQFE